MKVSNFSFEYVGFDIFFAWFTNLNREGPGIWLFCYSVTLLCSVTLGTTSLIVSVSVWVLWCPILNFGANVLHLHSADRWKTFEGEQVYIMSDTKDNKNPEEKCCGFPYLWKNNNNKKKDKRFKALFLP